MRALALVLAALASSCAGEAPPPVVTLPAVEPTVVAVHACGPADPAACHTIAEEKLPTNPQLAYQYEHYACETGVAPACGALGHMMLRGIWGESKPEQAVFYLQGACAAGIAASCVDLGVLERDVRHDDAGAIARFSRDCESRRIGLACDELGRMVEQGRGFARDAAAARRLFERACALGASAGCGDVGRVLLESDRDRALELLGAACRAHDGSSCYELGLAAKSQARAQREFVRACNLGFAAGCISAAWTFDPAERSPAALSWMDRACDERAVAACELLADRLGAYAVRERVERMEAK